MYITTAMLRNGRIVADVLLAALGLLYNVHECVVFQRIVS